jgi:indolepyruvate ferredoxin oxidoreductase, alpha subunit
MEAQKMAKKFLSGNEAAALAALNAGVKVISGYPGTPSTELIGSLWNMQLDPTKVEWSANEKVAFEVASAAAISGYRAICTMKMSGLNVAYDSLIGIAYSGCPGGFVVYVADDPGVSAGMCEQDIRGFAIMSDMVVLEPGNAQESYDMTRYAFELSEAIGSPVFVRTVTEVSQSHAVVEVGERTLPPENLPILVKDTDKYTKAGAVICKVQHKRLIDSLAKASEEIEKAGLNKLSLSDKKGGLGIICVGSTKGSVTEALSFTAAKTDTSEISVLRLAATLPYADKALQAMLAHCGTVIVVEELEPHIENRLYLLAYKNGAGTKIVGKNDGAFSRIGEYTSKMIARVIFDTLSIAYIPEIEAATGKDEQFCAARPITVCAGCPHRGVYMSINQAIKNLKYKKEEVIVTGDIGCTILGSSGPFNTLWTELSMGASIPLAQGFVYSDVKAPVVATIGDSTFLHAGMSGLVNAIQHNVNITVIVMDNGWTAMTGMQVNANTANDFQHTNDRQIDLEQVIKGLGVDSLTIADPYDLKATTAAVQNAMTQKGVNVVLTRRECAIQAARRKVAYAKVSVDSEKCTLCKVCVTTTGCPAISLNAKSIELDYSQCNGCGVCAQVCPTKAIIKEEQAK